MFEQIFVLICHDCFFSVIVLDTTQNKYVFYIDTEFDKSDNSLLLSK